MPAPAVSLSFLEVHQVPRQHGLLLEHFAASRTPVNLRKSEISGYNFRSRRALRVRDLTIGGGKMTYLEPTKAFKYLGIRVSITGVMREERKYIEQATAKMIKSIVGHQCSPAQMHWVVQVAIIPMFRYSAALAGWTEGGLQTLEKAWTRAFRQAWRTGKPPRQSPSGPHESTED